MERGGTCCAAEALETRRIDPRDFDRSENFHASLKRNDRDMEGMISCTFVTHSKPIRIRRLDHQAGMHRLYATTLHALLRCAQFSIHSALASLTQASVGRV